ncbi:MAG: hypothetical protein K2H47_03465 [Muribaculaceae bacterium]|nr:hypothetical protein [Muribaculaceae bacterium]
MKLFLILLTVVCSLTTTVRAQINAGALIEDLGKKLAHTDNAKDSLKLLYDIYDLSERRNQSDYGWKILELNRRLDNVEAQADMLCQLSVIYLRNDSILRHLYNLAGQLPEGDQRSATQLFVSLQRTTGRVSFLNEEDRMQRIRKILMTQEAQQNSADEPSLYEQIQQLYSLVLYMGTTTRGSLYEEYLDKLSKMIDELPEEIYQLRNMFYTSSANFYTNNDMHDKAIEADRKLLNVIESLQKEYKDMGRDYRNYETFLYICYRRMLNNYEALDPEEVDHLRSEALKLVHKNKDIKADYDKSRRIDIYYNMAKKNYPQAVTLINEWLKTNHDKPLVRRQMLGLLKEAAEATGDHASLLSALKEYNGLLEEYNNQQSAEAYREMQIRYDVSELKARAAEAEIAVRDAKISFDQKIILISLSASFVLIVVLLMLARRYGDMKRNLREVKDEMYIVKDENSRLSHHRERLQKEVRKLRNSAPLSHDSVNIKRSEQSPYAPPVNEE